MATVTRRTERQQFGALGGWERSFAKARARLVWASLTIARQSARQRVRLTHRLGVGLLCHGRTVRGPEVPAEAGQVGEDVRLCGILEAAGWCFRHVETPDYGLKPLP